MLNLQEKPPRVEPVFNIVIGLQPATLLKETSVHIFSWKHCEYFEEDIFAKHLCGTPSGLNLKLSLFSGYSSTILMTDSRSTFLF